jgi:endonuclease-3
MAQKMIPDALRIHAEITRLFPDAGCELKYSNEYQLLMAIMLSAQTTDESVNRVTPGLFAKFPTISAMAEASLPDIEAEIVHLGLYKNKAKFLRETCRLIQNRFYGTIPSTQEELQSLPGVGRKTANVFLAEGRRIPAIAVDTHVHRVSLRLGFAEEKDSLETVERNLMSAFPREQWIEMHHKMIFFGRYFCKAKKPLCPSCPLLDICKKPSCK